VTHAFRLLATTCSTDKLPCAGSCRGGCPDRAAYRAEEALSAVRSRLATLELEAADSAPLLARAQERWFALSSLRERLIATVSLAAERVRLLSEDESEQADNGSRDPELLRAQAESVPQQEQVLIAESARPGRRWRLRSRPAARSRPPTSPRPPGSPVWCGLLQIAAKVWPSCRPGGGAA